MALQVFARSSKFSLFDPAKEMVYIEMTKEEKSKVGGGLGLGEGWLGSAGLSWLADWEAGLQSGIWASGHGSLQPAGCFMRIQLALAGLGPGMFQLAPSRQGRERGSNAQPWPRACIVRAAAASPAGQGGSGPGGQPDWQVGGGLADTGG